MTSYRLVRVFAIFTALLVGIALCVAQPALAEKTVKLRGGIEKAIEAGASGSGTWWFRCDDGRRVIVVMTKQARAIGWPEGADNPFMESRFDFVCKPTAAGRVPAELEGQPQYQVLEMIYLSPKRR